MAKGKTGRRRPRGGHLASLDMDASIKRADYEVRLRKLQARLQRIQQAYLYTGDAAAIVFEGWDAAGKGGTIRRMSAVLDPRGFKVWPIAAPRRYHLERHYLTRFWERLPPNGAISVFDRSWYGRVLVERVEALTPEARWRHAYEEINEFEQLLTADGTRIVKIFLHVTPEVQLRRFEERLRNPMKRWKLSYEDFRNRLHWGEMEAAIEDMVDRTSTRHAPWHLISANDKKHARITALKLIADRLAKGVDLAPPPLDVRVETAAREIFETSDLITSTAGRTS
ncbi:polyphosphate kinase 2 family protein [Microbaculum sp. FT89]|uniref:polyphosphate kinase 2 family protein n=1 Tax=Microbaculum sp. FT89 TaxID=3447298 RepID=UPI003F5332B4